jgi:hypothetical protein
MLLPVHPLRSIRRSQGPWCEPPNRAPYVPAARPDGSMPRHQCRPLSPPGCLRIRLRIPPSLSWRNIGACRSRAARGTLRRHADLECRCIGSHPAGHYRGSAGKTPSDRSLRGESRRSDGTATTLRSSRADLAVFRGCHAFVTSVRRWGCAGRSYPSHATRTSRSEATAGARSMTRASRAHPTSNWHWSPIGMDLLCAQNVPAKSGACGW